MWGGVWLCSRYSKFRARNPLEDREYLVVLWKFHCSHLCVIGGKAASVRVVNQRGDRLRLKEYQSSFLVKSIHLGNYLSCFQARRVCVFHRPTSRLESISAKEKQPLKSWFFSCHQMLLLRWTKQKLVFLFWNNSIERHSCKSSSHHLLK